MGKSNRIRANRVNAQNKAVRVNSKRKGMPSWLMTLLTIVITVAVLAAVAVSIMSANGVFNRMSTVISTDHYKVNANMMAYYFHTQYQQFQEDYSTFVGSTSLDTSEEAPSLKSQTIDSTNMYDMYLTGSYTGTWYDYFMDKTLSDVSNVLVYCEEADARGIELTEEEKDEINASLDSLREQVIAEGSTFDLYLADTYGKGVKATDLRKAMEYSSLATKCASAIAEDLYGAIGADRINEKYAAEPDSFNVIDYAVHTLSVSYADVQNDMYGDTTDTLTDAQKAEVQAKYDAKVVELKAKAEQLKAAADFDAFEALCVEFLAEQSYDTEYDIAYETINSAETAGSTEENAKIDTPEEADLEAIRAAMVAEVKEAVLADKTEIDAAVEIPTEGETVTVYDKTVGIAFAKVLNETKQQVFNSVLSARDGITQKRVTKQDGDDFFTWAFTDGRAKLEKNTFETTNGEGETTSFTVSAYMLLETKRKDESLTRNVAYMLFQDQTLAKNAIEAFKLQGTMTLDLFDAYAAQNQVQYSHYDNYVYGTIGYSAFDEWLYDDARVLGEVTETPIAMDSYYAVAYYYGNGEASWYMTVKDAIFSEDSTNYENEIVSKYAVNIRENRLDKVDA